MRSILSHTALAAALLAALPASHADERVGVQIRCTRDGGKCPAPPAPPAPPAAPLPPPPPPPGPAPDGEPGTAPPPALPVLPVPPVPPAPPAIPQPPAPRIPAVPAAAHAACAGKAPGSALTWTLAEGEVMRGTCARRDGRMVFRLRSYALER